jgi:hypothetical protein
MPDPRKLDFDVRKLRLTGPMGFLVSEALKRGCRLVGGSSHVKLVGRSGELVGVLSYGMGRGESGHKARMLASDLRRKGYLGKTGESLPKGPVKAQGRRKALSEEEALEVDALRAALMSLRGTNKNGLAVHIRRVFDDPEVPTPSRDAMATATGKFLRDADYYPSVDTREWMAEILPARDFVPSEVTDEPGPEEKLVAQAELGAIERALDSGVLDEPVPFVSTEEPSTSESQPVAPVFPELAFRVALSIRWDIADAMEIVRGVWDLETGGLTRGA